MDEGDLVLAKIKGFPDWPAVIVPVDNIPAKLQTPKYEKFIDNYLAKNSDQVCVKFFYDDQYSWTKLTNVKPLSKQVVEDHILTANESKRGGRVKRITEAYIKARDVPIDEFLEYGSFGKPSTPQPEEEFEEAVEDATPETEVETVELRKRSRGGRTKKNPATAAVATKKTKTKTKTKTVKSQGKAKNKGAAKVEDTSSEEPFEDEEILEFPDNEDDEDFEGVDDDEDEELEDNDEEDEDEDGDDDDDDDDDDSSGSKKKRKFDIEISIVTSPFLSKQPADFKVKFADIPTAAALADEVHDMTSWCANLRTELQSAIFSKDTKPKQSVIDDLISPLITADLSKSIIKSTKLAQVVYILLSTPELQSATTKKLAKWWNTNFDFNITTDIHWSPSFTQEMHQEEETARRAHVAYLRQKRKEERKQSETPVPSST